jgi:hypothetical protein
MNLREEITAIGIPLPEDLPIDRWAAALGEKPCRNTLALVGLSSVLFYAAEKHHNPKVNDIWDAMVYCSTCLSVGYGDIFARTPIGKILGTALMTIGPAISGAALDGPADERRDATQEEILQTLRRILEHLQPQTAPLPQEPARP